MRVPTATAGQDVEVILDRSPLYAESGGQIADRDTITATGMKLRVDDVQKIAKKSGCTRPPLNKARSPRATPFSPRLILNRHE